MAKRILRGAQFAGVVLLVSVAGVYARSEYLFSERVLIDAEEVALPTGSEEIAEGGRLFIARGCAECHGADAGGKAFHRGPFGSRFIAHLGEFWGPNLTMGTGSTVSEFTTKDFVRAIRYGARPDGRRIRVMPVNGYFYLTDVELGRIIAFLNAVPPVVREPQATRINLWARLLFVTGLSDLTPDPPFGSGLSRAVVPIAATPAYGEIVARSLCAHCHGPEFAGARLPGCALARSPDLRLDRGPLAAWTHEQFVSEIHNKFRTPTFRELSALEIDALWQFLHQPSWPTP